VTTLQAAPVLEATLADREELRSRVRLSLAAAGLDGYIGFTPSNVAYLSGYVSYFLSTWWRMHGTVMIALNAQADASPVLIVGDAEEASAKEAALGCDVRAYPMWVETNGYAEILSEPVSDTIRPTQWREEDIDSTLIQALESLGLRSGRVGTDLRHLPHHTYERLRRIAPDIEWVDMTDEMYRIRAVKLPFEIERLRAAAELAEAGMVNAAGKAYVGATLADVRAWFFEGVAAESRTDQKYSEFAELWVIPGMGKQATISSATATVTTDAAGMQEGDLLKFDCGTTIGGYRSDHGRTFVLGNPSPEAAELYTHLSTAHALAVATMHPGAPMSAVFQTANSYMHAHGYPGYRRGHFGHSIGLDSFHEEPPFLGPDETTLFEVGMVFAVETPFYGPDLGPIMLEDLVLITDDGPEYLTSLPRTLMTAGEAPGA
jgi:Xaa-Pro dipeptidase